MVEIPGDAVDDFSESEISTKDIIYELSSIGCQHAASAMSRMLDTRVEVTIPDVKLIRFAEFLENYKKSSEKVQESEELLIVKFYYDEPEKNSTRKGIVLLLMDTANMNRLYTIMTGEEKNNKFSEMDEELTSLYGEVGNILISHYISSISDFLTTKLNITPPILFTAKFDDMLSSSIQEMSFFTDYVFLINTNILVKGSSLQLSIIMFFEKSIVKLRTFE
ncbi:MAG: chemotaxis protein CheC [Thermoplasmata archaeon]